MSSAKRAPDLFGPMLFDDDERLVLIAALRVFASAAPPCFEATDEAIRTANGLRARFALPTDCE